MCFESPLRDFRRFVVYKEKYLYRKYDCFVIKTKCFKLNDFFLSFSRNSITEKLFHEVY